MVLTDSLNNIYYINLLRSKMQQKDCIEIEPSTLNLIFPQTTKAKLAIRNVTLHQIFIKIISTNPDNYIIQPNQFKLEAFDEKQLIVRVKYYQEALLSNYLNNKFVIYNYDIDQEGQLWNEEGISVDKMKKISQSQVLVNATANMENYSIIQPKKKQLTLKISKLVGKNFLSFQQKSLLIAFLQSLGNFSGIHYLNNKTCLATFKQLDQNIAIIKQFQINNKIMIYTFFRLPILFKDKIPLPKNETVIKPPQQILEMISAQVEQKQVDKKYRKQHTQTFVFANDNFRKQKQTINKKRKRNYSLQLKNTEQVSEQDEIDQESKKQFSKKKVQFQPIKLSQKIINISNKSNQNVPPPPIIQKQLLFVHHSIINCILQPLALLLSTQNPGTLYILFESFLQVYDSIEKIKPKKKINIQKITITDKKITMKQFNDRIIVAIDCYFYVIDLKKENSQWIYVQRKQIFDFTFIFDHNVLAIGGRNFSKLSYFGKNTSRSNIKIYCFNQYKHLFTYDLQGSGDVINVNYMKINKQQVIFIFQRSETNQRIFFIRMNKWNDLQVLNKFELQDLAIKQIVNFRFFVQQIFGLEKMQIDAKKSIMIIKKFKIKSIDEKSTVATQSIKINPQIYDFFENDDQILILYSNKKQELIMTNAQTKEYSQYSIQKGFNQLLLKAPYLILMFDTFIEIKKLM